VRVRAVFSGTWYWALWGFHFEDAVELTRIQDHAQEIIEACGGGVNATGFSHPIQFASAPLLN
jgi:hypothetical protein